MSTSYCRTGEKKLYFGIYVRIPFAYNGRIPNDSRTTETIYRKNMEKEIKIDLVPKEQINEDFDCVRITCENICVWANCLESAIKAFDEALRQHR